MPGGVSIVSYSKRRRSLERSRQVLSGAAEEVDLGIDGPGHDAHGGVGHQEVLALAGDAGVLDAAGLEGRLGLEDRLVHDALEVDAVVASRQAEARHVGLQVRHGAVEHQDAAVGVEDRARVERADGVPAAGARLQDRLVAVALQDV
jgi:hypothetical protein